MITRLPKQNLFLFGGLPQKKHPPPKVAATLVIIAPPAQIQALFAYIQVILTSQLPLAGLYPDGNRESPFS
jgi:hypothetical protein